MKKNMRFLCGILLVLFSLEAVTVRAQTINPKAEFLSSSEKIVKGMPFSAEAINESVQILYDGNKIIRTAKSPLYRDSEGRFRRDEMPMLVGIGSFVEMPQMILILDPVTGVKFYLDPKSKTARQSALKSENKNKQNQIEKAERELVKWEQEIAKQEREIVKLEQELKNGKQELEEPDAEKKKLEIEKRKQILKSQKRKIETKKQVIESRKKEKKSPEIKFKEESNSNSNSNSSVSQDEKPTKKASKSEPAKQEKIANQAKKPVKPNESNKPSFPVLPKGEIKNETLGTRKIEGIKAEGTRLTTTIAAGAIGNERDIEIVYERWYSQDLQLIVFSKYSDPRFGEQSYRLTNVKRDEPENSLFTLPADYQIVNKEEMRITVPRKKVSRI